jgi:PAS domain S-box-containing protein
MVDRPPLRLVPSTAGDELSPRRAELAAALRLLKSERGALLARANAHDSIDIESLGLSPEEEAACRSLARRAWQQAAQSGYLASAMGEYRLIARPLAAGAGDAALVAAVRSRGGKLDAELIETLHDVGVLLEGRLRAGAEAAAALGRLAEEQRRSERLLALNRVFAALAEDEDVESGCERLLAELASQFGDVEASAVWLLEADDTRLRRLASLRRDGAPEPPAALPLGRGDDVDGVIETAERRLVTRPRSPRGRTRGANAPSATTLYVPLRSRSRVTGLLTLASRTQQDYTPDELAFLETLAVQLGGEIAAIRERERTKAESERLRTLIGTLPVGIALLDATGTIVLWNRAVEELWGHGPLATPIERFAAAYGLLSPEGRPLDDTPMARVLRGGPAEIGQEFLIRQPATGVEKPVIVNAAPILDSQGRIAGVVTVYQDISALREVDRLKDSFINTVSHELRTPVTTVRGGALMLLRRGDQLEPEVQKQLLQDMAEDAERLYDLVEDLLVLSRLQAGMQLQAEPIIVRLFINKFVYEIGSQISDHPLTISYADDVPMADAEPAHLERVLRNLLRNAVKFSPRGGRIEIKAEPFGRFVLFSVLDRGSGIPAADMDRVFEPFYKTPDAVNTGAQGAGLGLAVCRRLVEWQGGRIWAEPRPGGGTAFHFTLPAILDEGEE